MSGEDILIQNSALIASIHRGRCQLQSQHHHHHHLQNIKKVFNYITLWFCYSCFDVRLKHLKILIIIIIIIERVLIKCR